MGRTVQGGREGGTRAGESSMIGRIRVRVQVKKMKSTWVKHLRVGASPQRSRLTLTTAVAASE
jgi:LEA14-like dessication related protein